MWTEDDCPDQGGRVAVVTGANGGLGLEVARALARKGATVVMAVRDQDKARTAQEAIRAKVPGARLELRTLDLACLGSVRACAQAIAADHPRIDLLVNNAGIMAVPRQATAEGFEAQLGINHLGHFVLTRGLLPALLAAPAARVISVTSIARLVGRPVDPANPHLLGRYDPWLAYAQSKLANLLFALELDQRLRAAGAGVRSLAAHPGISPTNLYARNVGAAQEGARPSLRGAAARAVGMSPSKGALPLLRAATDPAARGGQLYGPRWVAVGAPVRRPVLRRARRTGPVLWAVSERETATCFDVDEVVTRAD